MLTQVVTGIFVDSAVSTRTEDEVVDAFTVSRQAEQSSKLCDC